MAQDIHSGQGVAILRGLQPSGYSLEENVIVYAGVASYIGETRGQQDSDGNVLGEPPPKVILKGHLADGWYTTVHIKDVGSRVAPENLRQSPYANNAQVSISYLLHRTRVTMSALS